MKKILLFFFIAVVGVSCANIEKKTPKTNEVSSNAMSKKILLSRLRVLKAQIDNLFNEREVIVVVKLNNQELVRIYDENFPMDTERIFNILKNIYKQTISVSEILYSQSGDWYITFTHYFDKDGKTFAFSRTTNYFNDNCGSGIVRDTKTEYYDKDFSLIDTAYRIVDSKDKELSREYCKSPYGYIEKKKIFANVESLKKAKGLNKY